MGGELVYQCPTLKEVRTYCLEQVDKLMPALDKWLEDLLGVLPSLVPTLLNIITDITSGLTNLLVGVVFSVYLLIDKERLCARVKKLTVAFLKKSRADKLIGLAREVNDSVGDFMVGKLMESLLMGVLSFVAFLIAGLEMPVLLSAIIAISNIVPFFGPLVGAIICGVILLLIHPSQLLLFVILEIVLIQLDANLIGPKILGKTTGLDALWIVVAILLGGSLFGFWGILLGVPCFAVIYALLRKRVNHCLADQGLTTATQEYLDYTGQEIHLMEDVDTQPKASLWQKTKQLLKKRKKKK
jgi:predicted PurR-regulated permease PerM